MSFDCIPACFCNFRRSVPSTVRGKASAFLRKSAVNTGVDSLRTDIDESVVILEGAQHFQSTQSPFSTLAGKDRGEANISMYRRSLIVYERQCILRNNSIWFQLPRSLEHRTAIVKRPHLEVSTLKLLRLADHSKGVTLSVATYMYVSVCHT